MSNSKAILPISQRFFFIFLIGLCAVYLGLQLYLNAHLMIQVDEFMFAHFTYQYSYSLPYRDFPPYKTVLGYYLLLIPMLWSHQGIIETLITIKNFLALINTFIFFFAGYLLTRFFSPLSVLISLGFLLLSDVVLFFTSNIRIDLCSYWFCFFSLFLLLEKRYVIAGFLLGLAFITSQKSLWYIIASNVTLFLYMLIYERQWKSCKNIFNFNISIILVIVAYILFWSYFAGFKTVLDNMFLEATALYNLDWYSSARSHFWFLITLYNPTLFLLFPFTLVSLLVTYAEDSTYQQRFFILSFSSIILLCLICYKQIFPYNMLATIPIFLLSYTAFYHWLLDIFKPHTTLQIIGGNKTLYITTISYFLILTAIYHLVSFPKFYFAMTFVPLLLCLYLKNKSTKIFNFIILILILLGSIVPLTLSMMKMMNLNGDFQKANLRAVNALTQDGSNYVAGAELFYNQNVPISGMRHLRGPAINLLYQSTPALRANMMPSMYEDPNATQDSIIQAIKAASIKCYVNNYMMRALPDKLKNFLAKEYEHYWGSIYLYAPEIAKGKHSLFLKFSGFYYLESSANKIKIANKTYSVHEKIYLKKGNYISNATNTYRLKLIPNDILLLDKKFQQDDLDYMMF